MNWSGIKNIIIYFLIGINIFLISCMGIMTLRSNVVPDNVIDASLKILADNGFKCQKNVIPDSSKEAYILNAAFYTASELSDIFFGKQVAFRTDGDSLIAVQDEAVLTVTSNYFSYDSGNEEADVSEFRLKHLLKKSGIDMSGSVYDEKTGYFYKMYQNVNLFNMYLRASVDSDGNICSITAQWPKSINAKSKVKSSFVNYITDVPKMFDHSGKIKKIEFGYALKHSQGNKYTFRPSWRITVGKQVEITE